MDIADFFLKDRFAAVNGIKLVEVRRGYAKASLVINADHLNAGGAVQGGALFTLADFCFAAASNSYGKLCFSIACNINFFKSAKVGEVVTAESKELFMHNNLANFDVDICNAAGELLARFSATGYRKSVTLPFEGL